MVELVRFVGALHVGGGYQVDPAVFFEEDNFRKDLSRLQDGLLGETAKQCEGRATCNVSFDTMWHDTLRPSHEEPVLEDFAYGFGQIRFRLTGNMTIEAGDGGRLSYSGSYQLQIGKDWNFDRGKTPEIFGVPFSLEPMREMQRLGLAREYFVTGSRSYTLSGVM